MASGPFIIFSVDTKKYVKTIYPEITYCTYREEVSSNLLFDTLERYNGAIQVIRAILNDDTLVFAFEPFLDAQTKFEKIDPAGSFNGFTLTTYIPGSDSKGEANIICQCCGMRAQNIQFIKLLSRAHPVICPFCIEQMNEAAQEILQEVPQQARHEYEEFAITKVFVNNL